MLRSRRARGVGAFVFLLMVAAAGVLLAADPQPGVESDQPYSNEKLGLKIAQPEGETLLFRTEGFTRRYMGIPVAEFRVKPSNTAPSFSGALLRIRTRDDFKTWTDQRVPTQVLEAPIKETEVLQDKALDVKPGEGRLRDFKFTTDFGTMFERHVYLSDGNGVFYELILTGNIREEQLVRTLMEKVTAGLSVKGVGAVGGGDGGPKPEPGVGVAGFVFSSGQGREGEELFLLKDGESKPIQITHSPGRDIQPAFSPDGTKIAFVSGRDAAQGNVGDLGGIYIMNAADGSDVKWIVKNGFAQHPRWSPDGKMLAFDTPEGPEHGTIHTVSVDGSGLKTLVSVPGWGCQDPDWSPDGTLILFNAGDGKMLEGGVYTIKPSGTGKTLVVPMPKINAMGHRARWSRNGKQIIFTGYGSYYSPFPATTPSGVIMICDADGSNMHAEHLAADALPVFMPKMHKIAFVSDHGGDGIKARDTNSIDIFVKNIDEVFTVNLTKNTGGVFDFDVSPLASDEPLAKPKLPYDIVFAHEGGGPAGASTHQYDIFVISEDGKSFANITQTNALDSVDLNPCWSPDKKKIVFESRAPYWMNDEREGRYNKRNIWVMDADGSHRVNLTKYGDEEFDPIWSPDGTTIAFFRRAGGGVQLFLMDPTGGGVHQVACPSPGHRMTWSNDSLTIVTGGPLRNAPMSFGTVMAKSPVWTMLDKRLGVDPDMNPTSSEVIYPGRNDKGDQVLQMFNFPGGMPVDVLDRSDAMHPSWAPDGCRIVFDQGDSGNSLFIYDVHKKGDPFNLTGVAGFGGHNVDPDWSSCPHEKPHYAGGTDCVIICCTEGTGYVLYMTKLDGSERKEVGRFTAKEFMNFSVVFAPNGSRCAAVCVENATAKIMISDLDGKPSRIVADGQWPCFSPDGSMISYVRREGLGPHIVHTLDLTQPGAQPVRRGGNPPRGGGDDNCTAWSADGKTFYFGSNFARDPKDPFEDHLYLNARGSNEPKQFWTVPDGRVLQEIKPSPDGKFVLAQCLIVQGTNESYLVNTDGSGGQLVAGRSLAEVAWSDDGKRIYTRGGKKIISANPDGSDARTLLEGALGSCNWISRGDKALLLGKAPSGTDRGLYTCGIDGSNPAWMDKIKGDIEAVIWCGIPATPSPSGQKPGEVTPAPR